MQGTLYQINIGQGGVPKHPIEHIHVTRERCEGDRWNYLFHGGKKQAVCLYALECLERLQQQGFQVFPGALGENFTTQGLDYHLLRIGDIFHVGSEVLIRLAKVRVPCGTIARAYDLSHAGKGKGIVNAMWDPEVKKGNVESPKWGMSGFYAEVLHEGVVHTGDTIEKILSGEISES